MIDPQGRIDVAVAGTPARLTKNQADPTLRYPCHAFIVEALPTNSGKIYVMRGNNAFVGATYANVAAVIAPPTTNIIPSFQAGFSASANPFNLADYYIDAQTNGEGVIVTALVL